MRAHFLSQARRLVMKIGSSILAAPSTGLRLDHIQRLANEIGQLKRDKRDIILVSSGAIVAGIEKLGLKAYPHTLPLKQAAASAGQSRLLRTYENSFQEAGHNIAQVLLTHQDLTDRKRFLNARHTLTTLLALGVIPVINENDAVAVEEIRFGDNDTLAAQVAHLVDADLLVILSDVDGLFTQDPRHHPDATLIGEITDMTPDIERSAGRSRSQESRGGMVTKIQAAKLVGQYGLPTLLLNGETPGLVPRIFAGADGGTLFLPQGRKRHSRKHWIAGTLRSRGQLILDSGAVEALTHRGKSLLPSGILEVKGTFVAGDPVSCVDTDGKEFARGLVNVSSAVVSAIKGRRTQDIEREMGVQEYEEVIHRDNLAMLL
ncbi:MAG: glutamate 5-kinase [Nitrospira sp.]|nr:glutamate 5-kinase [Nitrospira sp.]MDD9859661.1 glutamate 5-kinase [Nitrospira sp.]